MEDASLALFFVSITVWIVVAVIGFYNSFFRIRLSRMINWLEKQHPIIEERDDYKEEADTLYNINLPLARLYFQQSMNLVLPILLVQALNSVLVIVSLTGSVPELLQIGVAFGNAAILFIPKTLYKWRYEVEGMCRGTQVVTDAIRIQEEHEKDS